MFLLAPYQRETAYEGGPVRSLSQYPVGNWVEWETLDPWRCLVWVTNRDQIEAFRAVQGVERLPDVPLLSTLGELSSAERRELSDLLKALGYSDPLLALRAYAEKADLRLADARVIQVLQVAARRRARIRRDENNDVEVVGDRAPAKPLPGQVGGGAAPAESAEETFNRSNGTTINGKTSTAGNVTWGSDPSYGGNNVEAQSNEGVASSGTCQIAESGFSDQIEAWVEMGSGNDQMKLRWFLDGTGDGYRLVGVYNGGFPYYQAHRIDGYSLTQLGSNLSGSSSGMTEGYKIGVVTDGSGGHEFYEDTGSGWSNFDNRTDSTYENSYISFVWDGSETYEEVGAADVSTTITQTVSQVSETDSTLSPSVDKGLGVALNTESDSSLSITAQREYDVGITSDTETVPGVLSSSKTDDLFIVPETDSALSVSADRQYDVALTSSTDTALSITPVFSVPVSQASESESSLSLNSEKTVTASQAAETDEGLALTENIQEPVSTTTESDSALSVGSGKDAPVSQSASSESALSIVAVLGYVVNQASETDSVFGVDEVSVWETDEALPITFYTGNIATLNLVSTTDSATGLVGTVKKKTFVIVASTEEALAVSSIGGASTGPRFAPSGVGSTGGRGAASGVSSGSDRGSGSSVGSP